ncbi:MAG TPA: PAC2 family protein, partial [Nitrososphaeraceae archaeon]
MVIHSKKSIHSSQLIDRKSENNNGKTRVKSIIPVRQNKIRLNNPILIAGFPGPGLVGSISTSHIIEQLHMHQIACVESEFIVPGVIYIAGKIRHPFRLYSNQEGNVCVLVCEAPIMIQGIHSVLDTVVKWAKENEVREVMVLEGIPVEGIPDSSRKPMVLSSAIRGDNNDSFYKDDTGEKKDFSSSSNTTFIAGISGGLLASCLSNGIACKALLISASSGIPDPEGAAILIESISNIT